MICDYETNMVYLSALLPARYPDLHQRVKEILQLEGVDLDYLPNTRDIWCRDYMPVQLDTDYFLQFRFYPDYLRAKKYQKLLTEPEQCYPLHLGKVKKSRIVLDGGNVVVWKNRAILTSKVIDENSNYSIAHLKSELTYLLDVEDVCFIPQLPDDFTGHADGMVRLVGPQHVLVNDFRNYHLTGYFETLKKSLKDYQFNLTLLPWEGWRNKSAMDDTGDYMNFLQVRELILVPEYGLPQDDQAKAVLAQCFPDSKIYGVNCREIAKEGGSLHCCTWNIKRN